MVLFLSIALGPCKLQFAGTYDPANYYYIYDIVILQELNSEYKVQSSGNIAQLHFCKAAAVLAVTGPADRVIEFESGLSGVQNKQIIIIKALTYNAFKHLGKLCDF